MRSRFAMTMGWLSFILSAAAQAEMVQILIEVEPPRVWLDERGYSHVEMDGSWASGLPGTPALPARPAWVLLPPGQRVLSVDVKPVDLIELSGTHVVFPAQRQYPHSYRGPREFTEPLPAAYTKAVLPEDFGTGGPLQYKHGFAVLPLLVRPVLYRPQAGTLFYAPLVIVSVTCGPSGKDAPPVRGIPADLDAVRSMVANPGIVERYPARKGPVLQDARYLIITGQALSQCTGDNTLASLAQEKIDRGIPAQLKTTEDIYAEYAGADGPEKVRNFIRDMYQNHGTEYVLLAGDADLDVVGGETEPVVVPVRGLWGDIDYGGVEENLPSDIYYACLDGSYNADLDGVFGEPSDDPDLLAEVVVGRAPVDSCSEVANFVGKTLAYRASAGDYLKNVWMAGEYLGPGSWGSYYLEELRLGSAQDGIMTRGFIESPFFEVHTLYDDEICGEHCWGADEMLAVLNGGAHIVNHMGHSYTNYNMRLDSDQIDAGMINTDFFFQVTSGCYPGSFDNRLDPLQGGNQVSAQDSFTEHLLLGPQGGFAAVSCSRYGVGSLMERTFWDGAFSHGIKGLGELHTHAREVTSGWVENNYQRWAMYGMNYFGDPELELHMSNSADPLMGVPAGPLWFMAVQGEGDPDDQVIVIRNDGGGSMDWTATSSQPWLSVNPASGTAPTAVTLSVDAAGLPLGTSQAIVTFSAPGAVNSPRSLEVDAYIVTIPRVEAPHTYQSPVVDGIISPGEYAGAGFLDIGLVAPGRTVAKLLHDGEKLYLLISSYDDTDADSGDVVMVVFDNNDDDLWPDQPGDEGLYQLLADGSALFLPYYQDGKQGNLEMPISGVAAAFGPSSGQRVVELAFDLSSSHLKVQPGSSLAMYLIYFDQNGADYPLVGIWPMSGGQLEQCEFFGTVDLGLPADAILVAPAGLAFTAEAGGVLTAAQSLSIDATTTEPLAVTLQASHNWIQLSASTGTTPMTVDVQANPASFAVGSYAGSITVIAPDAKNSPLEVPVAFEVVEPAPVFDLQPESLSFEMTGGESLPAAKTVAIENLGGGTLEWTAWTAGGWYEVSPASGTAPGTVTVTPTDASLPAGSHTSLILFTASGAEPASVAVSLTVAGKPDTGGGCSTGGFRPGRLSLAVSLLFLVRRARRRNLPEPV